jgi:hypothetical protein
LDFCPWKIGIPSTAPKLPTYQITYLPSSHRFISTTQAADFGQRFVYRSAGQFTDPLQPKMGCLHQLYLVYTFRPKHFEDR